MGQIDRIGTFVGTVQESAFSLSSNGNPQWVARLLATKRYVTDPEEMKHFQIAEPAYVDWNFDESIVAYIILFTQDKGPMKNYEQVMLATGWSGDDFQDLTDPKMIGKSILFRVEENTHKDKTKLQVGWIDAADAPPERTLKSVDVSKIADLNKMFLAGMKKKPAAPAKPAVAAAKPATAATKPGAAPAPKPAAAPVTTPPTPPAPAVVSTSVPSTVVESAAPSPAVETPKVKKTPPAAKKATTPPAPAPATEPNGLPAETTKDAAWEHLNAPAVKGANDDTVIEDAWIAACQEVGPDRDEATFTGGEWARVRNIVLKDLDIKSK